MPSQGCISNEVFNFYALSIYTVDLYFPTITKRLCRGKVLMVDCVPELHQRVLHWACSNGEPCPVSTQRWRLNERLSGFDNPCVAYYVFIIITIESSYRGVQEDRLYRANIFYVSFSADLLCQFSYFSCSSSSVFLYPVFPIICMQGQNLYGKFFVWERLRKPSKDYIFCCLSMLAFLLLLHMCTVPPSSNFVGWALLVYNYSSIRLGSSTLQWSLNWDCIDSQAQLQGNRNQLEVVQVTSIHALDAACTARQLSSSILGGAHKFTHLNTFLTPSILSAHLHPPMNFSHASTKKW